MAPCLKLMELWRKLKVMLRFRNDYATSYFTNAPLAHALARILECKILTAQEFRKPVLDVGCGDGLFTSCLFDEPLNVGVDRNPKTLRNAKRQKSYLKLIATDAAKIPEEDNSFETILSNSALEHMVEIEKVLSEMWRLLSPTGNVYLTLPTDRFDHYSHGYQLLATFKMEKQAEKFRILYNRFWKHYHCYSLEDWKTLFSKHGFSVDQMIPYAGRAFCLNNDALTPLAAFSCLTKKTLGHWTLFPKLRAHFVSWFLNPQDLERYLNNFIDVPESGMVFFKLKKAQ